MRKRYYSQGNGVMPLPSSVKSHHPLFRECFGIVNVVRLYTSSSTGFKVFNTSRVYEKAAPLFAPELWTETAI